MIKRLFSLFILLGPTILLAQYNVDSVSVLAFQLPVELTSIAESEIDSLGSPLEAISIDSFTYQVAVSIPDTLNIASLQVTLSDQGVSFDSGLFPFDGTPPSGYSYFREEGSLILTMDQSVYRDSFSCEVVIKDLSNVASLPITYDFETILLDDE